ncbi:hypothetical protein CONCODRAFT_7113, partial [Conidiobolus coronatus NRRL 28638]
MSLGEIEYEIIFGIAAIVIGVHGIVLSDVMKNVWDEESIINATSLASLIFLLTIIHQSEDYSKARIIGIVTISIGMGFVAKKLTEKYGTKSYAIPRFLLGFTASSNILNLYLPKWSPMSLNSILIGLLFTPITLLTPNLIIAFLTILYYSYILASGITTELGFIFERKFNDKILTLCIVAVSGAIHIY